ncbi:MAG: hypothetical protein WAU01_15465 [Saprospiraceae bacterium]
MQKQWNFEILSWVFVVVLGILILGLIYMKSGISYHFYIPNMVSIVLFLTFGRIIFLLSYTPYSRAKWLKMILIFLPIPLFFYQVDSLYEFQRFIDEEGTIAFLKGSMELDDYNFGKFIKYQFIFFCVGSIVTLGLLPMRMIISFWRTTNTKDRV